MKDLDNQGVITSINIINPQGTQLEEHMHNKGQEESQMCLLLDIIGGDMGQIACKRRRGKLSCHNLMERIREENMQKHGCLE